MKIKEVSVENFRALKLATLECDSVTTMVGRNGAGKSAFLQALDLFYRPMSVVTVEDFHNRDNSSPITITVIFSELRPDELAAFRPYINRGNLSVTKKFEPATDPQAQVQGKYFAMRLRYPPFAAIDTIEGAIEKKNALGAEIDRLITDSVLPGTTQKPRNASQVTDFIADFENGHQDLLVPTESETQFFGDRNVGGGKLDSFTQFVYIPAVRDVLQDTSDKKASFAQLLEIVVMRKVNARPEVISLREDLQAKVTSVFSGATLSSDLCRLEEDLNETLHPFVPSASIKLDIGAQPTATFTPPLILPLVDEDNFKGEIGKKGHGLQRAVIMTLLTQLQRAKNTARGTVAAGGITSAETPEPCLILGIEEPELYQHPQRCRHFASVLRGLTGTGGVQVLQTTHSPLFVSLDHFDEIRLLRKSSDAPGGPARSKVFSVSNDGLRGNWAQHSGTPVAEVSVPSLLARVGRSMTNTVNEGFFADVVVLVEGPGDVGILTTVAERMGAAWPAKGIAVVPVNGKMNLAAPTLIFQMLSIPTFFIFDGDNQHMGKGNEKEKRAAASNRALLGLSNQTPEDFPSTKVTELCACFSSNVEQCCKQEIETGLFNRITQEIANEIGWDDAREVLKNQRGAEDFVQRVYDAGESLSFIEQIVAKIDGLVETTPIASETPVIE